MPAVGPLVGLAVGAISAYAQNRSQKKQAAPLLAAQTALANQQAAIAKLAGPALTETSDYYRTLLHGNRATLTTALQPEITGITELARGAERGLDRGPAGPQRDVAKAELGRQKVGQIGSLFPQARTVGAQGLAGIAGIAQGGAGTAASIFQSLMNGQRADQDRSDRNSAAIGEGLGGIITDFYKAWQNRSGGGGMGGWGGWNSAYRPGAAITGTPMSFTTLPGGDENR